MLGNQLHARQMKFADDVVLSAEEEKELEGDLEK